MVRAIARVIVTLPAVRHWLSMLMVSKRVWRFVMIFVFLSFSWSFEKNAELIFLPAAFTQQTGEAHWEIMIRARAIEAQAWVVACGTTGWHVDAHGEHRQTYGNSMIVNPWGEVVLRMGDDPGWSVAELDMSMVTQVRERMPVHANRRLV